MDDPRMWRLVVTVVVALTVVSLNVVRATDPRPPLREHVNLKECAHYCVSLFCHSHKRLPLSSLLQCLEPCMTYCKGEVTTFLHQLRHLLDSLDSMSSKFKAGMKFLAPARPQLHVFLLSFPKMHAHTCA